MSFCDGLSLPPQVSLEKAQSSFSFPLWRSVGRGLWLCRVSGLIGCAPGRVFRHSQVQANRSCGAGDNLKCYRCLTGASRSQSGTTFSKLFHRNLPAQISMSRDPDFRPAGETGIHKQWGTPDLFWKFYPKSQNGGRRAKGKEQLVTKRRKGIKICLVKQFPMSLPPGSDSHQTAQWVICPSVTSC